MSEPTEPANPAGAPVAVHEENYTTASIDGARIACATACVLVSLDQRLPEEAQQMAIECIEQAAAWLKRAREILPAGDAPSSLHVVTAGGGGLVLP